VSELEIDYELQPIGRKEIVFNARGMKAQVRQTVLISISIGDIR
jgi:hypothetical protein